MRSTRTRGYRLPSHLRDGYNTVTAEYLPPLVQKTRQHKGFASSYQEAGHRIQSSHQAALSECDIGVEPSSTGCILHGSCLSESLGRKNIIFRTCASPWSSRRRSPKITSVMATASTLDGDALTLDQLYSLTPDSGTWYWEQYNTTGA